MISFFLHYSQSQKNKIADIEQVHAVEHRYFTPSSFCDLTFSGLEIYIIDKIRTLSIHFDRILRRKVMKIKSFYFLLLMCMSMHLHAGYTFKDGWFVSTDTLPTKTAEEHYSLGVQAMECGNWYEGINQFYIVSENFPRTPLGQEAFFFLGVCYYQLNELDFANESFSDYLKAHNTPQYFEETIYYKFNIANRFRCGAKKRLFGTQQLPKWAPGYSLAVEIFDEIIAAVPCHDLAAQSLYTKGWILWQERAYNDSVDVLTQLIRRFPKHELAPESYLAITNIYLEQSQYEFQNPDLLGLAEINVRRFQLEFPSDERVMQGQYNLQTIKETYAFGLYSTGQFYERTKKPWASVIYYQRAISQFPDTNIAQRCYSRMCVLDNYCVFSNTIEEVDDGADAPT